MPQSKLSVKLNEFVNVLVEEELEPIRLDLIRIENDLKSEIEAIAKNGAQTDKQEIISQMTAIIDEKYDTLKSAIEELAGRVSEAIAEGLSEQEEHNKTVGENLAERITALEKRLGKIASSFSVD